MTMAKFRKKPVVIEAVQYLGECSPVLDFLTESECSRVAFVPGKRARHRAIRIETLEGVMLAKAGDWIIRGIKGELYPCKPDIFEATYEAVEGAPQ